MSIHDCPEYKKLDEESEQAARALSQQAGVQRDMPWSSSKAAMKREIDKLKEQAKTASERLSRHLENCPICRNK